MSQKVLVVTDYVGNLHIVPTGNKNYYLSVNQRVKDKQYKFRDNFNEDEAMEFLKKNDGRDPDFVTPAKAQKILQEKDDLIAVKDATIEEKDKAIEDLKAQLAALNAKTADNNAANANTGIAPVVIPPLVDQKPGKELAADVIAKIQLATSVEAVDELIAGEERKTVLDAAAAQKAKLAQLN